MIAAAMKVIFFIIFLVFIVFLLALGALGLLTKSTHQWESLFDRWKK